MYNLPKPTTVSNNIAYFAEFNDARTFGAACLAMFPNWRVETTPQGFAIRIRPEGDFLSPEGAPSMQREDA